MAQRPFRHRLVAPGGCSHAGRQRQQMAPQADYVANGTFLATGCATRVPARGLTTAAGGGRRAAS